jgi:hypothetical protein
MQPFHVSLDDTYRFAESQVEDVHSETDVLSQILKNIPHKPMKTIGHSFNQIPIPTDGPLAPPPPPFKPLRNYPPAPSFESGHVYPSPSGYAGGAPFTNPKAYDAYHTMTMKLSKPHALLSTPPLPGPISLSLLTDKDFEIQKSIQYEIKT